MKKIFYPLLAGALVASGAVYADNIQTSYKGDYKHVAAPAETPTPWLTGTFAIVSNYMFRGVSNSNNLPEAQGGFMLKHPGTGIYGYLWGSGVNFGDPLGGQATVEMDYIVGVTNSIGEHFTYDINFDRYNYPKSAASYNELIGSFSWYFLTAQVGYSTNVYNVHGNGTYLNLGVNYPIPAQYLFTIEGVGISGGVGHYALPANKGLSSYYDYNVQISKEFLDHFKAAVQWTDTSGSSFGLANDPLAPFRGNHFVASLSATF